MKALIADDEKPVRDCIQLLVDWSQYGISQVFEAEDGREAMEVIRRHGPMVVLMDIMMPLTGGLQLMDWIHSYASECRVIAISGYTDYDYVRQIFIQGGIDYIRKPIQPQKLYDALAKAVKELKDGMGEEELAGEAGVFEQIREYIDTHYQEELSLKSWNRLRPTPTGKGAVEKGCRTTQQNVVRHPCSRDDNEQRSSLLWGI